VALEQARQRLTHLLVVIDDQYIGFLRGGCLHRALSDSRAVIFSLSDNRLRRSGDRSIFAPQCSTMLIDIYLRG
jgi:hypothetical protein